MTEDNIQTIAARELIQPFDLESFQSGGEFLNNQAEVLKELHQRTRKQTDEIGVVLFDGMVLVKQIPLALGLETDMIQEHIKWEAEQFLIDSLNEYSFEYQRLPFQSANGNPTYLLVLLRKRILRAIRTLVQKAGLKLVDVDVDIFANIRTVLANYNLGIDKTCVLIDVQREYLEFIFIRNLEYLLSHRISLLKSGSSIGYLDSAGIKEILEKELRRLIFGHRIGQRIEDLERIFLIGVESIQKVSPELSQSISIPVEIVNPFRRIKVTKNVSQSDDFIRFPEKYITSIGGILKRIGYTG